MNPAPHLKKGIEQTDLPEALRALTVVTEEVARPPFEHEYTGSDPAVAEADHLLGLLRSNDSGIIVQQAHSLRQKYDSNVRIHLYLGLAYMQHQQYDKATTVLTHALQVDASNIMCRSLLADIYAEDAQETAWKFLGGWSLGEAYPDTTSFSLDEVVAFHMALVHYGTVNGTITQAREALKLSSMLNHVPIQKLRDIRSVIGQREVDAWVALNGPFPEEIRLEKETPPEGEGSELPVPVFQISAMQAFWESFVDDEIGLMPLPLLEELLASPLEPLVQDLIAVIEFTTSHFVELVQAEDWNAFDRLAYTLLLLGDLEAESAIPVIHRMFFESSYDFVGFMGDNPAWYAAALCGVYKSAPEKLVQVLEQDSPYYWDGSIASMLLTALEQRYPGMSDTLGNLLQASLTRQLQTPVPPVLYLEGRFMRSHTPAATHRLNATIDALLDIHYVPAKPLILQAWERGLVDGNMWGEWGEILDGMKNPRNRFDKPWPGIRSWLKHELGLEPEAINAEPGEDFEQVLSRYKPQENSLYAGLSNRPNPLPPPVQPREVGVRTGPKIGRNDPCPCGSGKKYKKCHGA